MIGAGIAGAFIAGLGVVFLLDVSGFGTRAMRFNLFMGAAPWKRDPEPSEEKVELHRILFGGGLVLFGLIVLGAAAANL